MAEGAHHKIYKNQFSVCMGRQQCSIVWTILDAGVLFDRVILDYANIYR